MNKEAKTVADTGPITVMKYPGFPNHSINAKLRIITMDLKLSAGPQRWSNRKGSFRRRYFCSEGLLFLARSSLKQGHFCLHSADTVLLQEPFYIIDVLSSS